MNIPLPAAGHWAKVAAGHQVTRPPLPAAAEQISYTSHPPGQANAPFREREDDAWLEQQDAHEQRSVITVEQHPVRWHRVASALQQRIEKRLAEVERWRAVAEDRYV